MATPPPPPKPPAKPRESARQALVADTEPRSPAAEAYRTLRTNIRFAGLDRPCRTILITSASPGEGKSTTVANFGIAAAQADARVCIIDSDLRRPSLHRMFGVPNTRGLTTALLEGGTFGTVAQVTHIRNLSVVTSGPLPPNPAELVGSRRMHECLESGMKEYDLLLFDSPPIISVSDALALSAQCEGVILVVRSGTMPQAVVRRTVDHIEAVKGRILGIVLNSVDMKRDGVYYDYYRYYTSYYGAKPKA
jgi:capsular exopolysaccharide synthesis family protein